MPKFVPCSTPSGDAVYVNLNNVLKLKELKRGGCSITFVNGAKLTVTSPGQTLVGQ